jgi:Ca2+-binding EF-hand superfamily protein
MNKFTLGLSLAALSIGGVVYAVDHEGPDADGDRAVTRAEAQAHSAEMFAMMDVNKDGRLDQADRVAHESAMRDEHFSKLDTNKDGSISRAEFDAGHSGGADGDRHQGPGMGGERMAGMMMMMQMADANKDQAISREEFTAAHLKHFEMSDTNKDGRLTPQERRAARIRMREHMRGKMAGHNMAPPPAN